MNDRRIIPSTDGYTYTRYTKWEFFLVKPDGTKTYWGYRSNYPAAIKRYESSCEFIDRPEYAGYKVEVLRVISHERRLNATAEFNKSGDKE